MRQRGPHGGLQVPLGRQTIMILTLVSIDDNHNNDMCVYMYIYIYIYIICCPLQATSSRPSSSC